VTGHAPVLPAGLEPVRRLGAGAFGEVFLARQTAIGRLVAVKQILPRALADHDNVERFRREARVLAATDCPQVVKVFDLQTGPSGAVLVMEYVPGATLADELELGPLPATDALRALDDVALALRFMSARGIVHRDIKPGNVFLLPDGHAKLGDFGLARALADESAFKTAGGAPAGTPAYFPPEVSQGHAEPDVRSDSYSFAVMAYEALTGSRPFEAPDALALIVAHWERPPKPPEEALPGIPAAASKALLAGLAKDPAQRPLPHELVERLRRIDPGAWPQVVRRPRSAPAGAVSAPTVRVPHRPSAPAPVSAAGRPRSPWLSRRRLPGLAALAIAATGLGVGAMVMSGSDPPLDVTAVDVDVDPDRGSCPRAAFTFTALIRTNGEPGVVSFRWRRPDGEVLPPRDVEVSSGQSSFRARLDFALRGRAPLEGQAVLEVLSPGDARGQESVRYGCGPR
jgi:eukaryotic-like serine/threonine-protein kinase